MGVLAENVDSGMVPGTNGFAFANFGANATPEVFSADDLAQMFGANACIDGVVDPCMPTTEAAAWARMVNEARASGHCEGLAVQAAARFAAKADPPTAELTNSGDVTHGIMRAFATQFLPEVQAAVDATANMSLAEIVNELTSGLKTGAMNYTLGVYSEEGGHAVLPYAIQFTQDNLAVIKVYDSNWPGAERYVVVDLKEQKWYFSFRGKDPTKDECAWSGGKGDLILAPLDKRTTGTCPFCGDKSTVQKTILLIRSVDDDWSVKTRNGTFSPKSQDTVEGVSGRAIRTSTCAKVVRIPEFILVADDPSFELTLPNTTSAYVSNGASVVEIKTKGKKKRNAVVVTPDTIKVNDPSTQLTVSQKNLAVNVTAEKSVVTLEESRITVEVSAGGVTDQIIADMQKPQVGITVEGGTIRQSTENLGLNKVVAEIAPELVPPDVKGDLPPVADRDLNNPVYVAQIAADVSTQRNSLLETTTTSVVSTTVAAGPTTTTKSTTGSKASTTTIGSTSATIAPLTTVTTIATTSNSTASGIVTVPKSGSTTSTTTAPSGGSPSSSPTTEAATTTTTVAPSPTATLKIYVGGTNSTLIVNIGWASDDMYQNWNKWSCTGSAGCDGATKTVPLDDIIYVRIQNGDGGYLTYGPGFGFLGTYINGNNFFSTAGLDDSRRCGSNWSMFASNTCKLSITLPNWSS